jgi:alkylhydroperoxidase family enzyme
VSRLRLVPGRSFDEMLNAAPGALQADNEMRRQIQKGIGARWYSLIGVAVAGLLGCEKFVEQLRGPLESAFAAEVANDWTKASLGDAEKAILSYAEKGTLDEASVRKLDIDALRKAGLADKEILLVATAIAYHNYSIRMAAAFDVMPRY